MGATATVRKSDFIDAMEENQKDVRYIVDGSMLEEYDDINLKNQFLEPYFLINIKL